MEVAEETTCGPSEVETLRKENARLKRELIRTLSANGAHRRTIDRLRKRPYPNEPASLTDLPVVLTNFAPGLLEHPVPDDVQPCVYFLIDRAEVVYVGQSVQLPSRLRSHRRDGKRFDRVVYLPELESQLTFVEDTFIRCLAPRLNYGGQPCPKPDRHHLSKLEEFKEKFARQDARLTSHDTCQNGS